MALRIRGRVRERDQCRPGDFAGVHCGDLAWVEDRPLAEGARAFDDLHHGRSAAAKILLRP